MEKLTVQEEDALRAVWKTGEGSVKSFLEQFEEPKPPYTTLASTIKKLETRGLLKSRLLGNTYLYSAAITEKEYKKTFLNGVVKNYFSDSYKELVNFFVEQKKLSPEELKEIIALIESGKDR